MIKSEEILMKLVESNARIEAKIDGLETKVVKVCQDVDNMEERLNGLELNFTSFKGKITGIAIVLSGVMSIAIHLAKKIIGV